MKIKKLIAILSSCIMLTSVMVGCDKDKDDSSSKEDATTTPTTSASDTTPAEDTTTEETTITEPDKPTIEADANAITFTGNDLFTAYVMNEKGFENDESNCNLSVVEYNGSEMLKIEVLDKNDDGDYKIPKIVFDVDKLVGPDNLSKIHRVTADVFQVAVGDFIGEDGTAKKVPGNLIGAFCGNGGEDGSAWIQFGSDFEAAEWDWDWTYLKFDGKILLPKNRYGNGLDAATLVFMRWGIPNQADIYLDNITFWDDDGNSIPIVYTPDAE